MILIIFISLKKEASVCNLDCDKNWGFYEIYSKLNNIDTYVENAPFKIAILDSDINQEYSGLKHKVVKSYNAIDVNKTIIDEYGHGTAVASIIAAKYNDKDSVSGVTSNAVLYDVKVLNKDGVSDIKTVVKGIEWCIQNHIDIINISFRFPKNDDRLERESLKTPYLRVLLL